MNKVFEIGRVTKDIELKTTPNGTSVVIFSLAVKRDFKNPEGNYDTDFFDCVAFNKLAETINRFVRKGDLFGVVGNLQSRTYTDKNGNNRKVVEIVVKEIEFLQNKREESGEVAVNKNVPEEAWEEVDPFADLDLPFDI